MRLGKKLADKLINSTRVCAFPKQGFCGFAIYYYLTTNKTFTGVREPPSCKYFSIRTATCAFPERRLRRTGARKSD
jgi:hypothetical protein